MAKLSWPPDDKHKIKYTFRDELELDENGMTIPLEDNKNLSQSKNENRGSDR